MRPHSLGLQLTRRRDEVVKKSSKSPRRPTALSMWCRSSRCSATRRAPRSSTSCSSGERCVCEMTGPLDQSQPLVSHHLALLRDAGIVRMRSEGARTYYSIDWERFDGELKGFLDYVAQRRSAPHAAERHPQRLRGRRQAGEEAQRLMTTGREWAMADDATGVRETDEQGLASGACCGSSPASGGSCCGSTVESVTASSQSACCGASTKQPQQERRQSSCCGARGGAPGRLPLRPRRLRRRAPSRRPSALSRGCPARSRAAIAWAPGGCAGASGATTTA